MLSNEESLVSSLQSKIDSYEKVLKKTLGMNTILKARLRRNRTHSTKVNGGENYLKCLRKVFTNTQIRALEKSSSSKSRVHWDSTTVKRALKLKFACGSSGYEELLKQNYPLPSQRTLRRKVENIKFMPGVLDEVLDFLKIKVDNFIDEREKDCCLVLDEMSIYPSLNFDNTFNGYIGSITLGVTDENKDELATHGLVYMLAGTTSRWKQTVSYHFTGGSVRGEVVAETVEEILRQAYSIGLEVICVTSDMGSNNQGYWKKYGITAGRYSIIINFFFHPCDPNKKVYVMPDPVHLFKNIRSALFNNKVISIPEDIVQNNNLPTNQVKYSHLIDLVEAQEPLRFKLAAGLYEEDLLLGHFDSMRVHPATNVISHSVVSGLKLLAEMEKKPEYLTTAWFLGEVERWFKLMTSRKKVFALSKLQPQAYDEAISFLQSFMDLFTRIIIGEKNIFKPCQRGVLIATQTMLDLQAYLLEVRKYEFVLSGRFTQDCLENLFSLVRTKQKKPNALQFKANLKLIMLSQYMRDLSAGSYDQDDREDFEDFLEKIQKRKPTSGKVVVRKRKIDKALNLNYAELNSLYCICGYLIANIKKNSKGQTCDDCIASAGGYSPFGYSYETLTKLKRFKDSTLFFCNKSTFDFFLRLEQIFDNFITEIGNQRGDAKGWLVEIMKKEAPADHILKCHDLRLKCINRYAAFRLKINSQVRRNKKLHQPIFSSKSMYEYSGTINKCGKKGN